MLIPGALLGLMGAVGGVWLLARPYPGVSTFDAVCAILAGAGLLGIVAITWSLPNRGKSRQQAR
jgi:hypothetical protein